MASRWDHLFEQKPIPLIDHLVEEVARLLARDLGQWPPPIQEFDPSAGANFAELLAPEYPRPQAAAYQEALKLARWNLTHDLDAYDDYMRNHRWAERGLPPTARTELLFLSRWLEEQMHGLSEATEGRVKRKQMLEILDRVERKLGLDPLRA